MSCRAFSRQIEHLLLNWIFDHFGVHEIQLEYEPTERNAPLQAFLNGFGIGETGRLNQDDFLRRRPPLVHDLKEQLDV
jgi:predicted enzyme involved in methoxymalonyl-ACP biosynthesis